MHSSLSQSGDVRSDYVCGIVAFGAVVHQANDNSQGMGVHILPLLKCDLCPYITSTEDFLMQVVDRSELQTCVQTRSCTWA